MGSRLIALLSGRSITGLVLRYLFVVALAPAMAFAASGGDGEVMAAMVVGTALTVSASIVLARRLVRPLESTLSAMDAVAAGQLETRLPGASIREFDRLAEGFNAMASRVQEATQRLVHQAFHDPLTGLPNRALFMAHFKDALSVSRGKGESIAVLFLDMDRFKVLNDTLGHSAGDRLLVSLSHRLLAAAGSRHVVARFGGDEFALLVRAQPAEAAAVELAEKICASMARPFSVEHHELFGSVSIGIAVSGKSDVTIADLLRRADVALYRSKADGKARYTLYEAGFDDVTVDHLDLDTALRRAVERGQLLLHYQPEVDIESGRIVGVEALLRWDHPHRGILSPADFIALAEETGEIVNIGRWVLEQSCQEGVRLNEALQGGQEPLVVAVNLSAAEFRQPGLVTFVEAILQETGLPPGLLKIEITESILMENLPVAMAVLGQLKLLGVRLAIDDFGTGYSSLSYLKQLPVDTLKIDQSFVADLGGDDRSPSIVGAIVRLGEALRLDVTAEGVETAEQLDYLRRLGCGRGQGNYFSRPVEAAAVRAMLLEPPVPVRRPVRLPGLRRSA